MEKIVRSLLCLIAAAALCSCGPRLVILHTNDTHSHFDPLRSGDRSGHGGVIERAAFIDSVRSRHGDGKVLLLHAGDWNQGSSYYSELGGSLELDVINAMRYDAVALGNHEFDNGIENLQERLSKLDVPVVCANLDLSPFELGSLVKPYVIIQKGRMKVGVIGLEADLTTCVSKTISSRIRQLDPVEVTLKWADFLKNEQKCNLVILLSHQGYKEDHEIASAVRNVDLIIGGHSHTFVEDFDYVEDLDGCRVPIVTDGCWGLEMGEITIR